MTMLSGLPGRRRRPSSPLVVEPARRIIEVADPGDPDVVVLADAGREIVEVEADDPTVIYVVEPVPLTSGLTGELVTEDEMNAAIAIARAALQAEIDALEGQVASVRVHQRVNFPAALSVWNASHTLGYNPAGVTARDTTGRVVHGEVSYPLENLQVSVRFSAPMSGTLELS